RRHRLRRAAHPLTPTLRRPPSTTRSTVQHLYSGKVRDMYDAGEGLLLIVASDRMSAFDVVMTEHIPDKGRVLTAFSAFWFDELADVVPNHLVATDVPDLPPEWLG